MEKIASFTIDHIKLKPGVYVSRKDHAGSEVITTFDLRMTSPNDEPVMNTAEVHTIEHLGATFLEITLSSEKKLYILALWAAAPAFIFCFWGITLLKIFCLLSQKCSPLSVISTMKSPALLPKTAEIIWT